MNKSLPAVEAALACMHASCNAVRYRHFVVGQGKARTTIDCTPKRKFRGTARRTLTAVIFLRFYKATQRIAIAVGSSEMCFFLGNLHVPGAGDTPVTRAAVADSSLMNRVHAASTIPTCTDENDAWERTADARFALLMLYYIFSDVFTITFTVHPTGWYTFVP